jgi:hypothetical protein
MSKQVTAPRIVLYVLFWPFLLSWFILRHLIKAHSELPAPEAHRTGKLIIKQSTIVKPAPTNALLGTSSSQLAENLRIPEPTRSLLFITEEDTSEIQSATGFSITISVNPNNGHAEISEDMKGFFAEPSLIWTKLPIKANSDLETQAMYWPAYSQFSPMHRYQYLRWLKDIEQPTNLSYVFLYFYGLERHLLVGEYDKAVDEILRLLAAHPQKSFRQYATSSLIVASLLRKRLDILDRAPFLLEEEVDEALALRIIKGTSMSPDDMMSIASRVGFTNSRYFKVQPELFKHNLQAVIDEFEAEYGKVMSIFKLEDFKKSDANVFANMSIPVEARTAKIPEILEDTKFQAAIRNALEEAHKRTKEALAAARNTK